MFKYAGMLISVTSFILLSTFVGGYVIGKSPVCRVSFESSVRQFNYEPLLDKILYAPETESLNFQTFRQARHLNNYIAR